MLTFGAESFNLGLRSIIEGDRYMKVKEHSKTLNDALKLHMLGHKDMIDNIPYANSTSLNVKLLTLDNELKNFIRERGLKNTLIAQMN
jgi:PIN domain nuclease of toxin-antitoxin system